MQTVSCVSCHALFPSSQIPSPSTTRCPRCSEPLAGPPRPRFVFAPRPIGLAELRIPVMCASCGCLLSFVERASGSPPICSYPLCFHKRATAAAVALQQKTLEEHAQRAAEQLDRVEEKLTEMGLDPSQHDIAVLPAFERSLTPMTDERRSALADRLAEIAAEMAQAPSEEVSASVELYGTPSDLNYVAQACATCRGSCCRNGENRAYLNRQTLTRALATFPGTTLEQLVRDYLSHVPEESYEESCIFHGEKGCALPTEMRSDACNDFFCDGVRSLSTIICGNGDDAPPVLAAALAGDRVVRLAVINGRERKSLLGD